jgi:1-acyl-sn-glycerol-3-phosphate acyltransferase
VAGQREPLYTLAKTVVPPVVRAWVRLECHGMEHLPDGPTIVAANHLSYFDPLCLGSCLHEAGRKVQFLAKSELFGNRALGWLLSGAQQIPVYRETRDAAKALEAAVRALDRGATVVVYPEGTTTKNPDFSPLPPKNGVARLAALTGAPVVPVGQWGAHLLFAQGRIGPFRRGVRVVICAGPPLPMERDPSLPRARVKAETARIWAAIMDQVAEAKLGWAPPLWHRPARAHGG